jgi:hypothetical protein
VHPPANTELYETPISTHWFDENGVMFAISKPVVRTVDHYQKVMDLYKRFTENGNKLCLLADATNSMPMSHEVRDFLTDEMPKYIKAHAIITDVPFESTRMQTFLNLTFKGFEVSIFSTKEEAIKWFKEYYL